MRKSNSLIHINNYGAESMGGRKCDVYRFCA